MGKLDLNYDITKLKGADYNPRKIKDADIEVLAESIRTLGIVKPLIVRNQIIVAGHQRTKALRSLGIDKAPVYTLSDDATTYDEVRFNQLHNGTDLDSGDENCFIDKELSLGYQTIDPTALKANFRGKLAIVRSEIASLIVKYGPWGGIVATTKGEVIHAAQYALAAAVTGSPLLVYGVEPERKSEYQRYLSREYGQFSYSHLPKETYIQSFAQMSRLRDGKSSKRGGKSKKQNESVLYRTFVIPWLNKNPTAKGLDFGSGFGDYAAKLRKKGHKMLDLELFRRKGNVGIDVSAVYAMIDEMLDFLRSEGRFDYVVCDSVLNSIDSKQAESAIMTFLNVVCKQNGYVFVSGRKTKRLDYLLNKTQQTDSHRRYIEFLDEDGFTALYRQGSWFYQKFHDAEQVKALGEPYGFKIAKLGDKVSGSSWQLALQKTADAPFSEAEKAIEYEFNLPWPNNRTINRHKDVLEVVKGLYDS